MKECVGVIWEVHFWGREASDTLESLVAEDGCKMMLPSLDMEFQVRNRRRRDNGMTPHCSEPFDVGLKFAIAGNSLEMIQNVVTPHLLKSPEEITRIVEHNAGIAALRNQFRNKFSYTAVAPSEGSCVVVIAIVWMLEHMLEIADQFAVSACGDRGLVHVEGTSEGGLDRVKAEICGGKENGIRGIGDFRTADRWETRGRQRGCHGEILESVGSDLRSDVLKRGLSFEATCKKSRLRIE